MRRWALVGAVAALSVLAVAVGFVWLVSNTGCAALTLERATQARGPTPEGEPTPLDEARVRQEAPQLAALLDRAADEGRATEDHERTARAMHAYLQEAHAGPLVSWRGVALRVLFAVC